MDRTRPHRTNGVVDAGEPRPHVSPVQERIRQPQQRARHPGDAGRDDGSPQHDAHARRQ
jgi:hypothetical protein